MMGGPNTEPPVREEHAKNHSGFGACALCGRGGLLHFFRRRIEVISPVCSPLETADFGSNIFFKKRKLLLTF